MRKTNRNIKRARFFKIISVFALIQILIVLLIIHCVDITLTKDKDLKKETVIVEKTYYARELFIGPTFGFTADNEEYLPVRIAIFGTDEYSMQDLNRAIEVGDELTIEYAEKNGKKIVYSIKEGDKNYRTLNAVDNYLKSNRIVGIVVFSLIELAFLTVLAFYILFNKGYVKFKRK